MNEKRAQNRVFFEDIANWRDAYIVGDLANRVIPADGWVPDTSDLGMSLEEINRRLVPPTQPQRRFHPSLNHMNSGSIADAQRETDNWHGNRPKPWGSL